MWSRGGGVGQEKVDRLQRPTRLGRSFKFKFKVGAAAALAGLAAEGAAAGELQPSQLREALAQTQLSTEKTCFFLQILGGFSFYAIKELNWYG